MAEDGGLRVKIFATQRLHYQMGAPFESESEFENEIDKQIKDPAMPKCQSLLHTKIRWTFQVKITGKTDD